jgi:hypothetical protein
MRPLQRFIDEDMPGSQYKKTYMDISDIDDYWNWLTGVFVPGERECIRHRRDDVCTRLLCQGSIPWNGTMETRTLRQIWAQCHATIALWAR